MLELAAFKYEMIKMKDVCYIKPGKNITKEELKEGPYPVIGGGKTPMGSHSDFNCQENTIVIAKIGQGFTGGVSFWKTKIFVTGNAAIIEPKEIVDKEYLYYYLKSIQETLLTCRKGAAQPLLDKEKLLALKIPIPSLDKQEKIASSCIQIDETIEVTERAIKNMEETLGQFLN